VNSHTKLLAFAQLASWRQALRTCGKRLVVTNGCFDILHLGHVTYLEEARMLGDALLVGLNADVSVRELKGSSRPLNCEQDRALVLAALESVSAVCIFGETRATQFLAAAQPDVYVKGGDYSLETLDPDERAAVEQCGGRIEIIPFVAGKSNTRLLEQLARL